VFSYTSTCSKSPRFLQESSPIVSAEGSCSIEECIPQFRIAGFVMIGYDDLDVNNPAPLRRVDPRNTQAVTTWPKVDISEVKECQREF
jgi:hypothetical protein